MYSTHIFVAKNIGRLVSFGRKRFKEIYKKEVAAQKYVIFDEKLGKWMKYSGKMLIVCLPLLTQNTKVGGT